MCNQTKDLHAHYLHLWVDWWVGIVDPVAVGVIVWGMLVID